MYGKDAVTARTRESWFEKIRSGNLCVDNSSRSGRPTEIDTENIKVLLDANLNSTIRYIAGELQISYPGVSGHISKISYVRRLDAWVPRALTEAQMARRTDIYKTRFYFEIPGSWG